MSGYKRVNFYELCRLCATNQQKEKTHIFQEEGRKIQLQNKIQSCLSLKVCENDFLPKVVCSQCLRSLEECCLFRKECFSSETMLSSYFNNFRYTDDFKKSGKVYIKDTSAKVIAPQVTVDNTVSNTNTGYNVNILANPSVSNGITQETLPYYTLHLPTVVPQQPEPKTPKDPKLIAQPQIIYNLNTIKTVMPSLPKPNVVEPVNNIAVNSNGEVLTIAPLMDVDTYMSQAVQKCIRKIQKKPKTNEMLAKNLDESNVIKIDLTDFNFKEKLKTQQQQKYYPDSKNTLMMNSLDLNIPTVNRDVNLNTNVILNSTPRLNPITNINRDVNLNTNVILNSTPRLNPVTNINRNTTQKLVNFNNANVCTSNTLHISNINAPTDVINLNAEPPPLINSSNLNIPAAPAYNTTHYSVNASKHDVHTNMNDLFNCSSVLRNGTMQQSYSSVPVTNQNSTTFQCNKEQEAPPVKKHSCDICCKTFKRREHLYQHMKLHTGFRPFTCENCNKSFLRKEHLLRHMVAHSGQKNYTCTICDKSFSRNDNLLKHKKIHNKQNSFTCEVCQKQFVMEHYYFAHKRTHDNEKCINQVWGLLKVV